MHTQAHPKNLLISNQHIEKGGQTKFSFRDISARWHQPISNLVAAPHKTLVIDKGQELKGLDAVEPRYC